MHARLSVGMYGMWLKETDDAENLAWLDHVISLLEPRSVGHYVGECDLFRRGRARRCFGSRQWSQLEGVTSRYDPDNVFAGFPDNA